MKPVKKRKKRRPKYGRIVLSLLVFFGVIYFFVTWVYQLFFQDHLTYAVTIDTLNIENDAYALVMRNELIVDTKLTGKINYHAAEGEYVTKGHLVADIFNDGSEMSFTATTTRELNRIQAEFDYNVLEYDINVLKTQILFYLREGNYAQIPAIKKELSLKTERLNRLQQENTFLSNRISAYAEKTIGEGTLMEGQKKAILSPANGILTYRFDGLESFVHVDNVYHIDFDELRKQSVALQTMTKTAVQSGDQLFKIVDNATYYIIALLPVASAEAYKDVQNILVEVNGQRLQGDVYDVFANNDTGVVVVRMLETFQGFEHVRWVSCKLIKENYRGLKVPTDAIVNLGTELGVYLVDTDRRLKYVPIKVIGYNDNHAIVYNQQFYEQGKGIVRSITASDEIVRNAAEYKPGDRVD